MCTIVLRHMLHYLQIEGCCLYVLSQGQVHLLESSRTEFVSCVAQLIINTAKPQLPRKLLQTSLLRSA